jgi:rRNA maturation endonuclease Nob1
MIFGIMLVYAMSRMALYNKQIGHKKCVIMKILGSLFVLLSCFEVFLFMQSLLIIEFPQTMIDPFLGPDTIVQSSDVSLVWGQPTFAQAMALDIALAIFISLGIAIYIFLYKKSYSKWYTKIWKIFLGILLCALFVNATNFNYFDIWEFVIPVLFVLLFAYIIKRKPTASKENSVVFDKKDPSTNDIQYLSNKDVEPTETMNIATNNNENELIANSDKEIGELDHKTNIETETLNNIGNKSDEISKPEGEVISDVIMYCKHCGKQIEADSLFCRYCGGDLRRKEKYNESQNILSFRISSILSRIHDILLRFHFPKIKLPQKNKIKHFFKLVGIITVFLLVIIATGIGIYYYKNVVIPEKKATEILNDQTYILEHYNGDALYQECSRIINYKFIPSCGDTHLDTRNLSTLKVKAWSIIKRLAKDGNADAQFMLGVLYEGYDYDEEWWNQEKRDDGSYFNPNLNYARAAYWYLQSAKQGNDAAMYNLANMYYYGKGVIQDYDQAIYWVKLSAKKGNDLAQLLLGDYYRFGIKINMGYEWVKDPDYRGYYDWTFKDGYIQKTIYKTILKQDIDSAKYWWRKSAAQGNETAQERLEKIY